MSQFHSNLVAAVRQLVVALQKWSKRIRDARLLIVRHALVGIRELGRSRGGEVERGSTNQSAPGRRPRIANQPRGQNHSAGRFDKKDT